MPPRDAVPARRAAPHRARPQRRREPVASAPAAENVRQVQRGMVRRPRPTGPLRPAPKPRPAPRPTRRAAQQSLTPFARRTPAAPTNRAERRAERRQGRAERRVAPVQAPYIPHLAHPTRAQRQEAARLVRRSIKGQREGERTFGHTQEEIERQRRVSPELNRRIGMGEQAVERSALSAAARQGEREAGSRGGQLAALEDFARQGGGRGAALSRELRRNLPSLTTQEETFDELRDLAKFTLDPDKYKQDLITQIGSGVISRTQARNRYRALTEADRGEVQALGLNTGLKSTAATRAITGAIKSHVVSGGTVAAADFANRAVPKIVQHAAQDIGNLPTNAVKALWEMSAASYEMLSDDRQRGAAGAFGRALPGKGGDERAKAIVSGLTQGVVGLLASGKVDEAWKVFKAHPAIAALEVSGVYGGVGRAAGAGGRLAGARVAQTARRPIEIVPGTNLRYEQSYSKNLLTSLGQQAAERVTARRHQDPDAPFQAQNLRGQRARDITSALTGGATKPGQRGMIRQIADVAADRAENVRRTNRDTLRQTLREAAGVHFRGDRNVKKHRDLLMAAVENRITPKNLRSDLRREKARLDDVYENEHGSMTPGERVANRRNARTFQRALDDEKFLNNPERFFAAAQWAKARSNQITDALVEQNVLTQHQATAAEERPRAVAEGARYEGARAATPEGAQRFAEAKAEVDPVRRQAAKARRAHERALREHGQVVERERQAQGRLRESDPKAIQESLGELDERHTVLAERVQKAQAAVQQARTPEARTHHEEVLNETSAELERVETIAAGLNDELKAIPERKVAEQVAQSEDRLRQAAEKVTEARQARREAEAAVKRGKKTAAKSKPKQRPIGLQRRGERLSTEGLVAEREAAGLSRPGFVTHRADTRGKRSFFVNSWDKRQSADVAGKVRTGEASRRGSHEQSYQALEESLARSQGIADAARAFDHVVHDAGMRHESGRAFYPDEALAQAEQMNAVRGGKAPGERMVPVRMAPARYGPERDQMILDMQDPALRPADMNHFLEAQIRERLDMSAIPGSRQAPNVVLMPKTLVDRFSDHQLKSSSQFSQLASKVTGQFRSVVLPFSPKWFTGNIVEGILRTGINGVLPLVDYSAMQAVRKRMRELHGEEAAKAFEAQMFGGLIFGTTKHTNVYTEGVMRGTALEMPKGADIASTAGARQAAAVSAKTLAAPIRGLQRGLFGANKAFEKNLQLHAGGHIAREQAREMKGAWRKSLRLQGKALDDLVNGLMDTPAQVRFARSMDEMLGKYQRFSPNMRRVVQNFAPFLPWYLNSVRFIFHTLPARHPVKTALLANVQQTFEKQWAEQYKDTPPGDLQQAPRTKKGGYLPFARFTPFGVWGEVPSQGGTAFLDPLLPQLSSALKIQVAGQNFAGRQLQLSPDTKVPHREGQRGSPTPTGWGRSMLAAYSLAESMIPLMQYARRLQERGETPYDDSMVIRPRSKVGTAAGKPGVRAAANRVFNPGRPTYLQQPGSDKVVGAGGSRPSSDPITRAIDEVQREQGGQSRGVLDDPAIRKALDEVMGGG